MPRTEAGEAVESTHAQSKWVRILERLHAEVGDVEYRNWLRQMTLAGVDGDEVTVHIPTRFLRDWVSDRYGARLNALWQSEDPSIRRVELRVGGVVEPTQTIDPPVPEDVAAPTVPASVAAPDDRTDPKSDIAAALDSRFTFEGFVVGKPNEFDVPPSTCT